MKLFKNAERKLANVPNTKSLFYRVYFPAFALIFASTLTTHKSAIHFFAKRFQSDYTEQVISNFKEYTQNGLYVII